jgi:ribosomal protein S12 methylthiotransferase
VDTKYAPSTWRNKEYRTKFYDLADGLSELGVWIRMHYVYPYPHVDEVIPLMAEGKILPYLDIPFQHASPKVLKAMKRPAASEKVTGRIKKWREICPDLTLRSTFIVGFPSETEEDFQMLLDWMEEAQIERAGCFKYEAVGGAKANEIDGAVPEEVKEERWHRFMQKQQEVSAARLQKKVGTTQEVMVDANEGGGNYIARTKGDAPEIDGIVKLTSKEPLAAGQRVMAKITGADEYDLEGVKV